MANLHFSHKAIGDLIVEINPDEIDWAYSVNTAGFPTYGGEVIQILSVYIDDLHIKGTIKSYKQLEAIYSYFGNYMIVATQGNTGEGSYDQTPMTMTYTARNWTFQIQPMKAPGFRYDLETVAPEWEMSAHVVDEATTNQELKNAITTQILNNEDFSLKGIINPAAANPEQNPFSAPGTKKGGKFTPATADETREAGKSGASYLNKIIKSYTEGNYEALSSNIGSHPAFGMTKFSSDEATKEAIAGQEQKSGEEQKQAEKNAK